MKPIALPPTLANHTHDRMMIKTGFIFKTIRRESDKEYHKRIKETCDGSCRGFATGGPIISREHYLIGERGPETLIQK